MTGCDTIFDQYTDYFTVSNKFNSWSDIQEMVKKAGVEGFKKANEVVDLLDICINNLKNNKENQSDIDKFVHSLKELEKAVNNFKSLLGHYKKDVPEIKLVDGALGLLGKKIAGLLAIKMLISTLHKSQMDYEAGKNYLTPEEFLSAA